MSTTRLRRAPSSLRQRTTLLLLTLSLPLALAGCAMEVANRQPARVLAAPAEPAAVVYSGWRVFQAKCASCHGADASGGERAPDLLPLVRDMSARHFTGLVLKRYDLDQYGEHGTPDQATSATRIDDILQRRDKPIDMPAWQDEPSVNAHIVDIFAYLSARADGSVGPGRPAQ